jgi:hypothetical protein
MRGFPGSGVADILLVLCFQGAWAKEAVRRNQIGHTGELYSENPELFRIGPQESAKPHKTTTILELSKLEELPTGTATRLPAGPSHSVGSTGAPAVNSPHAT